MGSGVGPQVTVTPAAAREMLTTKRSNAFADVGDAAANAHQRSPVAPSWEVHAGPLCKTIAVWPTEHAHARAGQLPPAPPAPRPARAGRTTARAGYAAARAGHAAASAPARARAAGAEPAAPPAPPRPLAPPARAASRRAAATT